MAAAIEVVWVRRGGWHARLPERAGEWVRLTHGHPSESASDLELLRAVEPLCMPADVHGATLRRLEPADRLPRESGNDTRRLEP